MVVNPPQFQKQQAPPPHWFPVGSPPCSPPFTPSPSPALPPLPCAPPLGVSCTPINVRCVGGAAAGYHHSSSPLDTPRGICWGRLYHRNQLRLEEVQEQLIPIPPAPFAATLLREAAAAALTPLVGELVGATRRTQPSPLLPCGLPRRHPWVGGAGGRICTWRIGWPLPQGVAHGVEWAIHQDWQPVHWPLFFQGLGGPVELWLS